MATIVSANVPVDRIMMSALASLSSTAEAIQSLKSARTRGDLDDTEKQGLDSALSICATAVEDDVDRLASALYLLMEQHEKALGMTADRAAELWRERNHLENDQ